MNHGVQLQALLTDSGKEPAQRLAVFALLNLGMLESLDNGLLSAAEAVNLLFHGDNCLYVRRQLRDKTADEIMGRGTQLPDLFDVLPPVEAHREFRHELAAMRSLCFRLLEVKKSVA